MIVEETNRDGASRQDEGARRRAGTLRRCVTRCSIACAPPASRGAHMSVRRRYDPSLPPVDGHRDLLIQAFLNIIKNVFEAGENKSELTIVTSFLVYAGRAAPVPPSCRSGRGRRQRAGITPDLRDNIFDPFVSGKRGGSGLGLALVASVAATEALSMVPCRGGRSWDHFPPAGQASHEFAVRAYSWPKTRVGQLVVQQRSRGRVTPCSQRHGRGPLEAHRSGRGDVLISDIALPDGDALDLLPRIQQHRPDMR